MLLELLPFLLPVLILLPVWVFAIYKYGVIAGLITGFAISYWLSVVYVYLSYALRPNSTTQFYFTDVFRFKYLQEILSPLFVCLIFFIIATFLLNVLIQWHKTGALDLTGLAIWIAAAILVPGGYYGYQHGREYLKEHHQKKHFLSIDYRITHDAGMPIAVDRLGFKEAAVNRSDDDGKYIYQYMVSSDDTKDLDNWGRITLVKTKGKEKKIPIKVDQLLLSWYSIKEDRYYRDTLDFSKDQLTISDVDGHQFIYGTLEIAIHHGGRVSLFIQLPGASNLKKKTLLQEHVVTVTKEISDEKRQAFQDLYIKESDGRVTQKSLAQAIKQYQDRHKQ